MTICRTENVSGKYNLYDTLIYQNRYSTVLVTNLSENHRTIVENGESCSQLNVSKPFPLVETNRTHAAFVQRLPQALSYVAELESGAHAILFYDNLAAAAEYLCAFIEEGTRRQQATIFVGLSKERYETLFDQVGINVAILENSGYLRHITMQETPKKEQLQLERKTQMNFESLLRRDLESDCQLIRFILLNEHPLADTSFRDLMQFERWLSTVTPATVLCCYEARQVLDETFYDLFTELLKAHGHCLFQGIAMPTNTITGTKFNASSVSKPLKLTNPITPVSH